MSTQAPSEAAEIDVGARARAGGGDLAGWLRRYGVLLAFLLIVALFTALNPQTFFSLDNAAVILNNSQSLGILALGLTVCLVVGEFDLSIGYVASFIGMLSVGVMVTQDQGAIAGVLAGLAAAAAIGLVNGLVVTRLGVASLITTLSVGSVAAGLNYLYGRGDAITSGLPTAITDFNRVIVLNVRGVVFVWLGLAVVLWFVLGLTEYGRRAYAVGSSPRAARMSGVNVERTKVIAFVVCSLIAGLCGLAIAASTAGATPQAGDGLLLDAYAAAFLGSVVLREGQFNVVGTVVAVLLLKTIENGLAQAGVDFSYATIVKGLLLIGAVALARSSRRKARV